MKRLALAALLIAVGVGAHAQIFDEPVMGDIPEALQSPLMSPTIFDVNLETLGDDLIAGEYWTPDPDFSGGTKYSKVSSPEEPTTISPLPVLISRLASGKTSESAASANRRAASAKSCAPARK